MKVVAEQAHAVIWKYREAQRFHTEGKMSAALMTYLDLAAMGTDIAAFHSYEQRVELQLTCCCFCILGEVHANANAGWMLSLRLDMLRPHLGGPSGILSPNSIASDGARAWRSAGGSGVLAVLDDAIDVAETLADEVVGWVFAAAEQLQKSLDDDDSDESTSRIGDYFRGLLLDVASPSTSADNADALIPSSTVGKHIEAAQLGLPKDPTSLESLVWELRQRRQGDSVPGDPLTRQETKHLLFERARGLLQASIDQGWTNGFTYLGDVYFAYGNTELRDRGGAENASNLFEKAVQNYEKAIQHRHARGTFERDCGAWRWVCVDISSLRFRSNAVVFHRCLQPRVHAHIRPRH